MLGRRFRGAQAPAPPAGVLSAYYPNLDLLAMRDHFEELGVGIGSAGIPDPYDHEAVAPNITSEVNCATAAEVVAAWATPGTRAKLTANINAVSIASVDRSDIELHLNGFTCDGWDLGGAGRTYARLRARGPGNLRRVNSSGDATSATDISIVGLHMQGDGVTTAPCIQLYSWTRVTISDCCGRGPNDPVGGRAIILGGCNRVGVYNSSFGGFLGSTADDWAIRESVNWSLTAGAAAYIHVDNYYRGGPNRTAVRASHTNGSLFWSTPTVRGTSKMLTAIQMDNRSALADSGTSGTPPVNANNRAVSYVRIQMAGNGTPLLFWHEAVSQRWRANQVEIYGDAGYPYQANMTAAETLARNGGCDADYGLGNWSLPNTMQFFTTETPLAPPTSRDCYLYGHTVQGDPYAL